MAGKDALETGFFAFRRMFDSTHGGFGGAPKFPRPSVHNFLLRYSTGTGNAEALEMVRHVSERARLSRRVPPPRPAAPVPVPAAG